MVHLTSKTQGVSKSIPCVFIFYKILTTFKLAVIAPAMVVTCPTLTDHFVILMLNWHSLHSQEAYLKWLVQLLQLTSLRFV